MHIASFESCKTLYELSGWRVYDYLYWPDKTIRDAHEATADDHATRTTVAAYDLGYMLRRLPASIQTDDEGAEAYSLQLRPSMDATQWIAGYASAHDYLFAATDATPEDAIVMLAVELFTQGVLPKEKPAVDIDS
jgi:hypothetical protein